MEQKQYAIMRVEKIKSITQGNARLRHNRRELPCNTIKNPDAGIKSIYTKETKERFERLSKMTFKKIFNGYTKGQKVRSNAVLALEFMLTFTPGAISEDQFGNWISANMKWLTDNFGGMRNVIDTRFHLDETTPHIHCMVIPLDEKGKLNARGFLGGTRDVMRELQTSYAKAMEPFGLERGIDKRITKKQHEDCKRWTARQAENETRLTAYEKTFGTPTEMSVDDRLEFSENKMGVENERKDISKEMYENMPYEIDRQNNNEFMQVMKLAQNGEI